MTARISVIAALALAALAAAPASPAASDPSAGPSSPAQWAALAGLPDWGGVWTSDLADQVAQFDKVPPAWTPAAAKRAAQMQADDEAGHPHNFYLNCLPEGMPGYMLITRNAFEVLFTPGRVTILGEMDGNRLRRIYTDGRAHPDDPDLTFHGHSIGRWEGDALVVDTIGLLPENVLPVSQSVGVPNDGDMHIVERLHLAAPDELHDDLEITAPHVLATPWKTTRIFRRHRGGPGDEIVEASCRQGDFNEARDADGFAVFVPRAHDEGGAPLATVP